MAWVDKDSTRANEKTFIVESETDLAELPDCDVGSFAYNENVTEFWQKNISGEWVKAGGEE